MLKIDIDQIFKEKNPTLYKMMPQFIINYVKRIVHQDEINEFISKHGNKQSFDFVDALIADFNITVNTIGLENVPAKGGCIVASNHPMGGMDAIASIHVLKDRRRDMKFIVNDILLNLKNLEDVFIGVNKHGKNTKESLESLDNLYKSDKCVLIYPAGLVSRKSGNSIKDLEWRKSFISKAKRHHRNVIPAFISGRNSNFFYNLANIRKRLGIKANIEMLYLSDELHKHKNSKVTIVFGAPIDYKEFNNLKTDLEWAQYVKEKVYSLESLIPKQ